MDAATTARRAIMRRRFYEATVMLLTELEIHQEEVPTSVTERWRIVTAEAETVLTEAELNEIIREAEEAIDQGLAKNASSTGGEGASGRTGQEIYEAVGRRWLSGDLAHPRDIVGERPDSGGHKPRWVYDSMVSAKGAYGLRDRVPQVLRQIAHTCHLDPLPEIVPPVKKNASSSTIMAFHGTKRPMAQPTEFRDFKGMDFGPGFYLATSLDDTVAHGRYVYEAEVELKNPIVISATQHDQKLVDWFMRVLSIEPFNLEFYQNPIVGVFQLFAQLVEMDLYKPRALVKALAKKGYDGVYVEKAAIAQLDGHKSAGDYVVIWSPEQILSWTEVPEDTVRALYLESLKRLDRR